LNFQTPSKNEIAKHFTNLCQTIAQLRDPVSGCPWDLEQTHETLRRYMIEEAYEAAEVMHPVDHKKLADELGDVLLQVVLNSQIATDDKFFTIVDVIQNLDQKMRRRHPHVFQPSKKSAEIDSQDVRKSWDEIKQREKHSSQKRSDLFSEATIKKLTPSLVQAIQIGKIANKINFDWKNPFEVLAQFKSEVDELSVELQQGSIDCGKVYEEMGDVLFSLAQLCRHLDIDPEVCGLDGNRKFLRRFKILENVAAKENINPLECSTETLERLWKLAKDEEKGIKKAAPKGDGF
jgi:MazG family protein